MAVRAASRADIVSYGLEEKIYNIHTDAIVDSLSLSNPTSPIGTRAAAAGALAHGVARMVTHAIRSAAIVAAVATSSTFTHGVAGVVGDGVVGCLHCICLSIQTMQGI